nr:hypothetical protein BaRGS_030972 [Batillaria attramentaria]
MLGKTSRHLSQKENMTTGVKGKGVVTPVVEKRVARSRVEGVFAYLKSPDVPQKDSERRESLSLEEVFQHHLALGVKNSSVKRDVDPLTYASQSQDEERGPLDGVIIAVSKKLSGNQMEYNSIVTELGGDYTWQSSEACTHFIFQGGVVKTDTPGSSRALRRSARKTPRPGQEDSQSAGAKTPSRALKQKAWQESMSQMQGWREAAKSALTPKDSAKGSLEFVAENAAAEEVTYRLG